MAKVALINYYARLLHKDAIEVSEIPSEMREDVQEALTRLFPPNESNSTENEDAGVV